MSRYYNTEEDNTLQHGWVTSKISAKRAEQKSKEKEYNHQYYLKNKDKWGVKNDQEPDGTEVDTGDVELEDLKELGKWAVNKTKSAVSNKVNSTKKSISGTVNNTKKAATNTVKGAVNGVKDSVNSTIKKYDQSLKLNAPGVYERLHGTGKYAYHTPVEKKSTLTNKQIRENAKKDAENVVKRITNDVAKTNAAKAAQKVADGVAKTKEAARKVKVQTMKSIQDQTIKENAKKDKGGRGDNTSSIDTRNHSRKKSGNNLTNAFKNIGNAVKNATENASNSAKNTVSNATRNAKKIAKNISKKAYDAADNVLTTTDTKQYEHGNTGTEVTTKRHVLSGKTTVTSRDYKKAGDAKLYSGSKYLWEGTTKASTSKKNSTNKKSGSIKSTVSNATRNTKNSLNKVTRNAKNAYSDVTTKVKNTTNNLIRDAKNLTYDNSPKGQLNRLVNNATTAAKNTSNNAKNVSNKTMNETEYGWKKYKSYAHK